MTFQIGRSRRGAGNLTSTGLADITLEPTLKGAWKVQYSYIAFGQTEYQRGPAGLGPFVAAQLLWAGVHTAEQAQLVRFLSGPGEIEGDASGISGVDAETFSEFLAGKLPTAKLGNPNDKEACAALYNELPQDRNTKFDWRDWFGRARQIAVIYTPRPFDIPEDDPLFRAFSLLPEPATEPVPEEIPK